MATVEQIAAAHQRRQIVLARRAADRAGKLWSEIDRRLVAASWHALLGQLFAIVSSAQGLAAAASDAYVGDALSAQRVHPDAVGRVNPLAFTGVASDGRDLASLLQQPVVSALTAIKQGATAADALTLGRVDLDMIVRTQIADAGRVADQVALVGRPQATGYVRMVSAGACSRCLILAGKHFKWNAGFLRHPRCQCRNVPTAENVAGDLATNPRSAFDAMSKAEQDKTFTKAGAQAIRDGADMNQVVNARRGMSTTRLLGRDALTTTEAAGRRPRLMPEQIYADARGDRDEALRLLRLHGFIL